MLFIASCEKDTQDDVLKETGGNNQSQKLALKGRIDAKEWGATAFRVQLTRENNSSSTQVFVTENDNSYEFNNIEEGRYTLSVTKDNYRPETETFNIKKESPILLKNINMSKNEDEGFTSKLEILDENGEDVSSIKFTRNTSSVLLYLFNGTGLAQNWNIRCIPDENFIAGYFIINGVSTLLVSDWIKEVKPSSSGRLNPNEIVLLKVVVDPFLYTLRESSSSTIYIDYNLDLHLSY